MMRWRRKFKRKKSVAKSSALKRAARKTFVSVFALFAVLCLLLYIGTFIFGEKKEAAHVNFINNDDAGLGDNNDNDSDNAEILRDRESPRDAQELQTSRGNFENEFYIEEISDELFAKMYKKSYKEDCTVPREDLRYLHLLHIDFEGRIQEGEMVVNKEIADTVLDIFKQLYEAGYPIEKIRLIDEYDADDERSMEDNNTSAFNFRFISYTTTVSKHGQGMAVDINPLYNPYVKEVNGKLVIEPASAGKYVDRTGDFDHKIDENDLAYKLFTAAGFTWGGSWSTLKDYQHFERSASCDG